LAPLRQRVEEWLAEHPEDAEPLDQQRSLARLWEATTPPEPSEAAWATAWTRLETLPLHPATRGPWRPVVWLAGVLAAGAAAAWGAFLLLHPEAGQAIVRHEQPWPLKLQVPVLHAEPIIPFEVATAEEVEILRVNGADTSTLVVGTLPLHGTLELVSPGDVEVQRAEQTVRMGSGSSPMIWAPLPDERSDPDD
jgi:hypothetical protein